METTTTPAPHDWGYARCEECGRAFDLLDADAANEWLSEQGGSEVWDPHVARLRR